MSFRIAIARKAAREVQAQYQWLAERSERCCSRLSA
jgi:hypothetical protein